jgi:hypothetical protein
MACALPGIASGIGIDPTLPRDGTDFMTLRVVMRIVDFIFFSFQFFLLSVCKPR